MDCYVRMKFGKYRGKLLSSIPDAGYLLWLLTLPDLQAGLRGAVQREIERREANQAQPPPESPRLSDLRPVADEWRRQLAREFHPDFGGSHEAMKAVNRGYELLVGMAEAAR